MAVDQTIKGAGEHTARYPDTHKLRVAIVHARWNSKIVDPLVEGAVNAMLALGVIRDNIEILSVPGSYELPYAVQSLAPICQSGSEKPDFPFDSVIAIGTLIKGETMHFEYISDAVTKQLMAIQFSINRPVIFGLLTLLTEQQGLVRAGIQTGSGDGDAHAAHNHGEDWGKAAVEMAVKRTAWSSGQYLA